MFGGSSKSKTTVDSGDKNYQQAGNEQGMNLAGISAHKSSISATDNKGNEGFLFAGNISSGKYGTTNIELTDHGAVAGGLNIAGLALSEMREFGSESLWFADRAGDRQAAAFGAALEGVSVLSERQAAASRSQVQEVGRLAESLKTDGASTMQRNMLYLGAGILVFAGVVVVVSMRGKK